MSLSYTYDKSVDPNINSPRTREALRRLKISPKSIKYVPLRVFQAREKERTRQQVFNLSDTGARPYSATKEEKDDPNVQSDILCRLGQDEFLEAETVRQLKIKAIVKERCQIIDEQLQSELRCEIIEQEIQEQRARLREGWRRYACTSTNQPLSAANELRITLSKSLQNYEAKIGASTLTEIFDNCCGRFAREQKAILRNVRSIFLSSGNQNPSSSVNYTSELSSTSQLFSSSTNSLPITPIIPPNLRTRTIHTRSSYDMKRHPRNPTDCARALIRICCANLTSDLKQWAVGSIQLYEPTSSSWNQWILAYNEQLLSAIGEEMKLLLVAFKRNSLASL